MRPMDAGVAQVGEHQPSKLRVAGSNPVSRWNGRASADVAQMVERFLGKEEVTGSIPVIGLCASPSAETAGLRRQAKKTEPRGMGEDG